MPNAIIGGVTVGLIYALLALALALIFRSGGVFNLGLSATSAVGVYLAISTLHWRGESVLLVIGVALVAGGVVSGVSYVTIFEPIERHLSINATLATLGFGIALEAVSLAVWGPNLYGVPQVNVGSSLRVLGGTIGSTAWGTLVVVLLLAVLLWAVLLKTRLGLSVRAVGQGAMTSGALGLQVRWVKVAAWTIAGGLGTVAAFLSCGSTGLEPGVIDNLIVAAFAGVVVGGFDSMIGVAVGSLIVGLGEGILSYTVAPWVTNIAIFVMLLVLLMLRPNGIFGHHPHVLSEPKILHQHRRRLWRATWSPVLDRKGPRYMGVIAIVAILLFAAALTSVGGIGLILAIQAAAAEALMVMGLYVVMGLNGQLALGLGAFGAVGAYAVAFLAEHWAPTSDVLVAIPVAVVVGLVVGFFLGLPCARLKGIYLGVLTVVFSAAVGEYVINTGWTGGGVGLALPVPQIFGFGLGGPLAYTIFELVVAAAGLVFISRLRRSGFGMALIMLRDAEPAAVALGLSASRFRVVGFMIGAAMVSVGGLLLTESVGLVTSDMFNLTFSFNLQAAYVIGGLTSVGGGLLGAGIFGVVPQLVPATVTYLPGLVLGGGLVVVLRFWPDGLGIMVRRVGELLVSLVRPKGSRPTRFPPDRVMIGRPTAGVSEHE